MADLTRFTGGSIAERQAGLPGPLRAYIQAHSRDW